MRTIETIVIVLIESDQYVFLYGKNNFVLFQRGNHRVTGEWVDDYMKFQLPGATNVSVSVSD